MTSKLSKQLAEFHNDGVKPSVPPPAWAAKILDEDRVGFAREHRRPRGVQ